MPEPLNIYEMTNWIRRHDVTSMRYATHCAEFVLNQHNALRISSEDTFEALKELMIMVIQSAGYNASAH